MNNLRTGICVICGKRFEYMKGTKVTCSIECKEERQRQYSRKRNEELKVNKPPKKINSNLDDIEKEARKLGMSYGKYMALNAMKES